MSKPILDQRAIETRCYGIGRNLEPCQSPGYNTGTIRSTATVDLSPEESDKLGREVELSNEALALIPVAGRQTIDLTVQVEPKPHLLEVRSLAGGEVYPGRAWLEEADAFSAAG